MAKGLGDSLKDRTAFFQELPFPFLPVSFMVCLLCSERHKAEVLLIAKLPNFLHEIFKTLEVVLVWFFFWFGFFFFTLG